MKIYEEGIYIEQISVDCRIGPEEKERAIVQRIELNLFLEIDLMPSAETDDLRFTVDYTAVTKIVGQISEESPTRTLEGLAAKICRRLLAEFVLIRKITINVRKPGVPGIAKRVSVTLQFPSRHKVHAAK